MKDSSPINIPSDESVNLRPEDIADADLLALDEETIRRLVEIIFSQPESGLPS